MAHYNFEIRELNHHTRSVSAIIFACAYLGISWGVDHRPANWEYVFLMFVVFSSAMQDALDDVKHRLNKLTQLVEESRANVEHLERDVKQEAEYLKCHITGEANIVKSEMALLKWEFDLAAAREKGEDPPEAPVFKPPYPEPKFIPLEPPTIAQFDAQKWRTEKVNLVADAVRHFAWLDMSLVTSPMRRYIAYLMGRPGVIRWLTRSGI